MSYSKTQNVIKVMSIDSETPTGDDQRKPMDAFKVENTSQESLNDRIDVDDSDFIKP